MERPIYLDYNATTPLDPRVVEAMRPYFEVKFGNPSSSHWFGNGPKKAVDEARDQIAKLLNCSPTEIVFTSGGTESNNHAIIGIAQASRNEGNHIITSQIEHPAVLEVCRYLERFGFDTTYLPVDHLGMVNVDDVEKSIKSETTLITIMHANNEVGTIQPITEIARLAEKNNIVMHTDAAQSIGKIQTDVKKLGVDLLSIAGHKVYAPKGVGALYIRESITPDRFCYGAGQESGRRAGTENVIGIVGLGAACEIASEELKKKPNHSMDLRDRLQQGLTAAFPEINLNGHQKRRLPNTLSLSFSNLEADQFLFQIGDQLAASAGAACHSEIVDISHVLQAMKVPGDLAKGTIRFSTGRMTTESEIDSAIEIISNAVKSSNFSSINPNFSL